MCHARMATQAGSSGRPVHRTVDTAPIVRSSDPCQPQLLTQSTFNRRSLRRAAVCVSSPHQSQPGRRSPARRPLATASPAWGMPATGVATPPQCHIWLTHLFFWRGRRREDLARNPDWITGIRIHPDHGMPERGRRCDGPALALFRRNVAFPICKRSAP